MRNVRTICSALVLLSFLAFPAGASAKEKAYIMTETELTTLESNLKKQKEENEIQKQESIALKTALAESQKASEKAKMESVRLSQMLQELKNQVQEQETLLERANQSLAEYEKEEKKKNKTLRLQRNLAYGLAISAVVAYVRK